MKIDSEQHLIPVGPKSLFRPNADSYYMFSLTATNLTIVNHFLKRARSRDVRELLYMEAYRDHLERTVKADEIVTGPFGALIAEKTCFYTTPTGGSLSSIKVLVQSAQPDIGREIPIPVPQAPRNLPPLTSISIVRFFRADQQLIFGSGNYEANGMLGSVQSGKTVNGEVQYGASIIFPLAPAFNMAARTFGLPNRVEVQDYLRLKRMPLLTTSNPEERTIVVLVYGFGKLIRQDSLKDGDVVSSRYLKPIVTKEDGILGPECDKHLHQQELTGNPTVN